MWVGTSLFAASRLTFADLADHHKNGLAFLFFIFTLPFQTRPSVWLQNLAWSVFLFFSQFSYASADFFPFPPRRGSVEGKKQATQPPPPPPPPNPFLCQPRARNDAKVILELYFAREPEWLASWENYFAIFIYFGNNRKRLYRRKS